MEQVKEKVKTNKKISTQSMVLVGMFTAVLAVMSQLSIPLPSGVPITLQTFAVALIGIMLGWKLGAVTICTYILVGAVGAPVFANFKSGFAAISGLSGGFLWGFIILAVFCGLRKKMPNRIIGMLIAFIGLLICHLCGYLQFSFLSGTSLIEVAKSMSVLYLPKDIISVIIAYIVGSYMAKILRRHSFFGQLD